MTRLTQLRLGTFSGAALSLRDALARHTEVRDVELSPFARRARLVPARAAATVSARVGRPRVPWTRTSIWPRALQQELERVGILAAGTPILCIGTWLALVPDPDVCYWIYTDRPALEGRRGDRRYTTSSRRGWLTREAAFLRGARGVFLTGESSVEVLVEDYGIEADRISVVGAAPNTDLVVGEFRAECRRFLFVGREWERKGGPDLLAAFTSVRADEPATTLEIVGCEPPAPLPDGVVVGGRIPHEEMAPVFARADALVLPSYHEATPFVILEALMQGIPVVGTTVGNVPSMVGDAGVCVRPGRPDELAEALRSMVTDHGRFRRLAVERGRALSTTQNWDTIALRMLDQVFEPPRLSAGRTP